MSLDIRQIRTLFYNPRALSVRPLLNLLFHAHHRLRKSTTPAKSIYSFRFTRKSEYKALLERTLIPQTPAHPIQYPRMLADLYRGQPKWFSDRVMYNVAPPPLLTTIAAKSLNALYNPNLVIDTASGEQLFTEKAVVKMIAEYVGWPWQQAAGTFTFGGKATTLYGIRMGLIKALPDYRNTGISTRVLILSTGIGHPSHASNCDWLGLGRDNIKHIPTDPDGIVSIDELAATLEDAFSNGVVVPTIILTGGSTNDMTVDPITAVRALRDRLVAKYKLPYTPHIHVDAVVGFPWIFFRDYDFTTNTLRLDPNTATKIRRIAHSIAELNEADSFGIDFHKLGFCPYVSSLLVVRQGRDLTDLDDFYDYNYPFRYTIENTRPADGPTSAYLALQTLGVDGYRVLLSHLVSIAAHLQQLLADTGLFEILNPGSLGTAIIFAPHLPEKAPRESCHDRQTRDDYTALFFDLLARDGNRYYIDRIPAFSKGGSAASITALKAYIISPFSSTHANVSFVEYLSLVKHRTDKEFNQHDVSPSVFDHPLL